MLAKGLDENSNFFPAYPYKYIRNNTIPFPLGSSFKRKEIKISYITYPSLILVSLHC